ncbi:MAG: hypothetical protein ACOY45_12195 [Pseudomonadota bacterium]
MRIAALIFWLALFAATPAAAQATVDPDAFTAEMAQRLAASFPDRQVRVTAPLTLSASPAKEGEDAPELFLDRIYNFCRTATPEACEGVKARYILGVAESFAEPAPVTRDQLRIVLREPAYCSQLDTMFAEVGEVGVTRTLAPGLCMVLVADYPNTTRILRVSDVEALKMAPVAAWELARSQTLAKLPNVDGDIDPTDQPVAVTDMDYVPSLMLDLDGWQRLSARLGRPLIVMVPADNLLVVDVLDRIDDIDGLRAFLRRSKEEAERGVSAEIYRWEAGGWVVVR